MQYASHNNVTKSKQLLQLVSVLFINVSPTSTQEIGIFNLSGDHSTSIKVLKQAE